MQRGLICRVCQKWNLERNEHVSNKKDWVPAIRPSGISTMKFAEMFHSFFNFLGCKVDKNRLSFIRHNKSIWRDHHKTDAEILFEYNHINSAIIAYSYFGNLLSKKHEASIIPYWSFPADWSFPLLPNIFYRKLSAIELNVYKSFTSEKMLYVDLPHGQIGKRDALFREIYPTLKNCRDVENLLIDGVLIGDLIYDTYLMANKKPKICIHSQDFQDFLKNTLGIYIFWGDYFNTHNVKAINVSHCVYSMAIPLRIAIKRQVPAYQVNGTHVYYLTKKNMWAYGEFFYFPEEFQKLPIEVQQKGVEEAERRINRRFSGEIGVDMAYSSKSAFVPQKQTRVLRESNRLKVFVALHCFFDSPHSYGFNLFPDFYEWVDFLGSIAQRTDYDWYLKTHPDFLPENKPIVEEFCEKYPKFTLLPADTSHHQIIADGIHCALSVYGTIGFEYAALGVPVINASVCNPHIAYDFNIHPKSVEEYEDILMNLKDLDLVIDKQEVYEYYFMKFMDKDTDNWLFNNYEEFLKNIGGYSNQATSVAYKEFMDEWSQDNHVRIINTLKDFIESKDFRLGKKHMKTN